MPPNDNRAETSDIPHEPLVQPITGSPCQSVRLTTWRKVAYGIGGPPMQMTSNTIGFFISIFLLETAVVSPFYNSVIVFSGRVWDAITDPCMGFLVSKTNTRLGKQRPWILMSTPFAVFGFFMFWYVPDIESMEGRFLYYLGMYFVYQAGVTAYHVPYSSMTMVLSDNQHDRDIATAFRMGFEVFGVLLGNAIFGTIITQSRVSGCSNETSGNMSNISAVNSSLAKSPMQLEKEKRAYMLGAGILCIIYIICALVVFFGVRERRGSLQETREPFFHSLKSIFSFKPYWSLMGGFLFISLGLQITQGNLALYATYSLGLGDQMGYAIMALLVSAIAFIPILQLAVNRFGKKTIFVTCQLLFIPILITSIFLPKYVHPAAMYALMITAGIVVSNAFLLPWSMLPDVIDAYMLEYGARRESAFYSFYVFFNKFATGVSLGLSQIVLGLAGYVEGQCTQPDSVGIGLRYLFGPGPLICVFCSIFFMYLYPINEDERRRVKHELEKLKKELQPSGVKNDRLGSCISSSATLPSLMHSADELGGNSRIALTPSNMNGNTRV